MDARNDQLACRSAPRSPPTTCPTIADQGFRAIICNRPDGEGMDQPTFEEIEAAARPSGLEARYLPITAGKVQDEDAEAFGAS
jgi:sulfide:quinone oxidoreductase